MWFRAFNRQSQGQRARTQHSSPKQSAAKSRLLTIPLPSRSPGHPRSPGPPCGVSPPRRTLQASRPPQHVLQNCSFQLQRTFVATPAQIPRARSMSQEDKNVFLLLMTYYYLSSRLLHQPQGSGFMKLEGKLLSLLLRNDRAHNGWTHCFCPQTTSLPPPSCQKRFLRIPA